MSLLPAWLRNRFELGKRVLWRPLLRVLGGVYALLAFLTWFLPAPIHDWVPLTWLRSLPPTTWGIAALSVLLVVAVEGSYQAVRGQYDLLGNIDRIAVGDTVDGKAIGVFVIATIRNVAAPTVLTDWALEIVLPNHRKVIGSLGIGWPDLHLYLGPTAASGKQVFKKDADLMEQTLRVPIPTGSQVIGVAPFIVQGLAKTLVMQKGTKIRLSYKDIRGNVHSAETTMTGTMGRPEPYIPGIGSTQGSD